jgi:tryptophan 7-halogenase
MAARLQPTDVLRPDPAVQVAALADGRLLVRHARGLSLLGGVSLDEVRRVAAAADGRRTAEEVCAALAGEIDPAHTRRVLRRLLGEVLVRVEAGAMEAAPTGGKSAMAGAGAGGLTPTVAGRVVVIVNDRGGRRLAGALSRAGLRDLLVVEVEAFAACRSPEFLAAEAGFWSPGELTVTVSPRAPEGARRPRGCRVWRRLEVASGTDLEEAVAGARLVVCAVEEVPCQALLAVQAACLARGVPALFVSAGPDGLLVGPTVVPGVTPCLGCARLAALRRLDLGAEEALEVISHLRVGTLPGGAIGEAVGRAVAAEARSLLAAEGEPGLLDGALLFPPGGGRRRLPLERQPDCPLCGGLRARFGDTSNAAEDPGGELRARLEPLLVASLERATPRRPGDDPGAVASVGILGGGTAGYLTALALRRRFPRLAVTVVESRAVGVIGVGEATTPLMPQFLHLDLGLDVHELFRRVRPTLKLGIRLLWGEADFNYPFGPVQPLEALRYGGDLECCSLASLLMAAGAVPLEERDGKALRSRLGTAVAYHLDNRRFVAYLQGEAERRGVERLEATIEGAEVTENGEEVAALVTSDGRRLAIDLYVDASGFRSLLLEGALGSPFVSFDRSLFTDRAVVAAVPHGGSLKPYTTAETMAAGWCWSTPQEEADHRGYVFSSAFLSDEAAEAEMRRTNPGMGEARIVRFRAGRHRHFWRGNVVAMGNAYGFVEPLESTALHLLVRQIGLLLQALSGRPVEAGARRLLDRKVGDFWDYLRWFLALHYRFNRRLDTPFWRACREEVDVSAHGELLEVFAERGPLSYDPLARAAFDYPDPLWGPEGIDLLLLGQGVEGRLPRPPLGRRRWEEKLRLSRAVAARALPQARALPLLHQRPELLAGFVQALREVGPAFP